MDALILLLAQNMTVSAVAEIIGNMLNPLNLMSEIHQKIYLLNLSIY
jgi:hypothetical protein